MMACAELGKDALLSAGSVLEIFNKCSSAASFKKNLSLEFPDAGLDDVDTYVVYTKAKRLNEKLKNLRKNKQENEIKKLCSSIFTLPEAKQKPVKIFPGVPQPILQHFTEIQEKTLEIVHENKNLKRNVEKLEESNDNLMLQIEHSERKLGMLQSLLEITNEKYSNAPKYKQENFSLQEETEAWEKRYDTLSKQFNDTVDELFEKKSKLQNMNTRNVNKKLKRREETIQKKTEAVREKAQELHEKELECENVRVENERMLNEVNMLKKERKSLNQKVYRAKKINDNLSESILHQIESLKLEISAKDEKIKELEQTNDLLSDPVIESFYEGKYTNELRATVMTLVTECGVSQKKVNDVMQTVIKNLTGKTLSRLPSTGIKSRLLLEAKQVANRQVAEALLENDLSFTLHQDGTSKFHKHFQSFQVTGSNDKSLSVGVMEVSRGDAQTVFDAFLTLLEDLSVAIKSKGKQVSIAKIVSSVIATMSDQAATNHVFNEKLKKFRADLLPMVYENWDDINEENQRQLGNLFSFFCKMHIFVNMASETDSCLSNLEKTVIADGRNPYAFHSSESGITRLIRTTSKAFTSHGCEKAGVGGHFQTFLNDRMLKNHLITFRGHRFNHLFHAAACTYYHLADVRDFLDKWSEPNELLRCIAFDVREPLYVAGVRALGLIDRVVTGPLWRIIEAVPNCLSLNTHLLQLKIMLESWSKNAVPFLEGECVFDESVATVNKDSIYDCLIAPAENPLVETYTQMALEVCFGAMLLILERQAKDQLPGGRYWTLNDCTLDQLSHVPTTNTVSERDFAQLDILMRTKPSANTSTYDSIIMWCNNKTSSWLHSLSDVDRKSILDEARTNAPGFMTKLKERQQTLFASKLQHLKERQEKKAKQEVKQHTSKVNLTKRLEEFGGLWTDIVALDSFKESCASKSKLRDAIVTQLQFRKVVLNSAGSKYLFQQQHKGKTFDLDDLERNLREVITLNMDENLEDLSSTEPKLHYKEPEQLQSDVIELKKSLGQRIEDNRKKVIISQQKELLPAFIGDPNLLVGKKIKHKCREQDSSVIEWYSADVVSIFQRSEASCKTEFNVRYDEDPESLWHFPLIKDMQKGDIIII